MIKIVRIPQIKKILLTLVIVLGSFVANAGFYHSPFIYDVKIIKCYPNPATAFITFEFATIADKTNTLQIFSFTGKKMTDQVVASNKVNVLLGTDFNRGIYVFQLRDKAGKLIESGKFQIVK